MSTSHKGLKTTVAVIVLAAAVAGGLYAYKPMAVKNAVESAIQKEVDSPTVAVIGNEKVTLADLEAFKQENPHLAEVPMQMIYGQLLDTYVNQKVLLGQAEKMNLKEDPTVKRLLSDAEKQLLMQAYLARQIEARMTPERLKLIYDAEMKNFVPVDEAKIHHILVNTETEAKDMIVQLNAGADFAELASKYSVDENSSIRGGELGYIRKDMLIPELGNAAFELKKGEYTKAPVKTPVGWHVIYVDDIRQTQPPAFEVVQEGLQKKFAELMAPEVLKEERTLAKVQVFDIYNQQPASEDVKAPASEEEMKEECGDGIIEEPEENEEEIKKMVEEENAKAKEAVVKEEEVKKDAE